MNAFAAAGAGFLLAVLWFDLMFDVQIHPHRSADIPEEVLTSISTYYRRVPTTARPMNRLIATRILATLAAIIIEITKADTPAWTGWVSLALATTAITLAGARTVPNAVTLGSGEGTQAKRAELARSIYHDHLLCFAAIAGVLTIQLAFAH